MINVSHMEVNELDDSNAEMINNQNDQTNVSIEKEAEEGEGQVNELDEIPEAGQAPEFTDDEHDKKVDEKYVDLEADGANARQKSNEVDGILAS